MVANAESGVLMNLQTDFTVKEVQLIRSAYRVIGERGLHRVSLQDVADVAGVSKGVVLYHFKSKENLILTTMRWALSRTAERIHESFAKASDPRAKVLAMIDAIFIRADANRNFYAIYLDLVDHAARLQSFNRLSATFKEIVETLYADVIREGVLKGSFEVADIPEAAKVLRAIIDGLFVQWMQEQEWQFLHPSYRETCKRAALSYLRADRPG